MPGQLSGITKTLLLTFDCSHDGPEKHYFGVGKSRQRLTFLVICNSPLKKGGFKLNTTEYLQRLDGAYTLQKSVKTQAPSSDFHLPSPSKDLSVFEGIQFRTLLREESTETGTLMPCCQQGSSETEVLSESIAEISDGRMSSQPHLNSIRKKERKKVMGLCN